MNWKFEAVAQGKGPATGVTSHGRAVLFAVPDEAAILCYDPATGETTVWRRYTGRLNGLAAGPNGTIYAAQESGRRVIELLPDGSARVTATRFEGAIHNFPAGLGADTKGRLWFCDSPRGVQVFGPRIFPLLEPASVMRIERDDRRNWVIRRVTLDTLAPRTLALSADEATLFVGEGEVGRPGPRELRAYPLRADGSVGPYRVLHRFAEDHTGIHAGVEGLCLREDGSVIACAGKPGVGPGPAIYLFLPEGQLAQVHAFVADCAPVNAVVVNGVLYVTGSDGRLYRSTMEAPKAR
jgi:gluconolactonase